MLFKKKENNNNNDKIHVSVSVKNTGSTAGKEVVQVYTSLPGGALEKEAHRLVAYGKTDLLQPGESQEMTLEIPAERLTSYDEKKAAWVLEKGFYGIFLGNGLESAELIGGVKLDQDVVTEKVKNLFLSEERKELKELAQKDGIKIIPESEIPEKFPSEERNGWLDTPECRQMIQELCTNPKYRNLKIIF